MDTTARNSKGTHAPSDLLRLYDDFVDFNDDCAFLCDAFAILAANSEYLDKCTVQGMERHAYWLKLRMNEFKERLNRIRESAYSGVDGGCSG